MSREDILKANENKRTRCEVFCRAMGYIRPVNFFNIGKKQEYADRKWFLENKTLQHIHFKMNNE